VNQAMSVCYRTVEFWNTLSVSLVTYIPTA
jgi:hypothetical protein